MPRSPKDQSDQAPPTGFTFLKPDADSFYGSSGPGVNSRLSLFLPTQLHSAMVEQRALALAAAVQEEADRRAADRAAENNASGRGQSPSKPSVAVSDELERVARRARQEAMLAQEEAARVNPHGWHLVYTRDAVANFLIKTKLLASDKDLRRRDKAFAQKMEEAGAYRRIAVPGTSTAAGNAFKLRSSSASQTQQNDIQRLKRLRVQDLKAVNSALDKLRVTHSHFSEVIDFVAQHWALSSRSKAALPMTPILLAGEAGVGKTHFASQLAEVIGTTFRRVSFDTPVTAASLMGSDRRWGNTQVGLIFEMVCLGQYANPIILLDENDKARREREWNPMAPLHTLLEPSTAAKVRDVSADFEFDASQIIWIATANDSRMLTEPIRSRFKEFQIERPDAAGALASSKAVLQTSFAALQLVQVRPPGKDLAVALAHLTPREITQVLKAAVATAIRKGKRVVEVDDLPTGICDVLDQERGRHSDSSGSGRSKTWLH